MRLSDNPGTAVWFTVRVVNKAMDVCLWPRLRHRAMSEMRLRTGSMRTIGEIRSDGTS
jgi:hypothetical protein